MVDAYLVVAVALLVAGVVGSAAPLVPGPLLSTVGVLLYWWSTGYAEPGTFAVAALLAIGVLAVVADFAASAVSARAGGASLTTTLAAGAVGILLMVLTGPVGMIVGIAASVFVLEVARHGDVSRGLRTATYTAVGTLGSTAIQVLFTLTMLVGFAVAVV